MRPASRIAIALTLGLAVLASARPAAGCVTPSKPHGLASATVERVSDGDTVRLRFADGRRERTRLLGLDAPEAYQGEKLERDVARTGQDRAVLLALGPARLRLHPPAPPARGDRRGRAGSPRA